MVIRSLAAVIAVVMAAGYETSQAQEPPPRVSWFKAPHTYEADYPIVAAYLGIRANAAVKCIANADGYARECVAIAHPAGFGFEEVAIEIAKRGQIKPNWPGDTTKNLTFSFNMPFGDNLVEPPNPSSPWDGAEPTSNQRIHAQTIFERIKYITGYKPYDGKIPEELEAAIASELAPENAEFLRETINTYGLTGAESDALAVRMFARMLTLPEVENRIERIIDFSDPQVHARMIRAEAGEGLNSATWRIRNAYCSRYDCTSKRAEEPEAPSHWQSRDDEPFPPYQGAD